MFLTLIKHSCLDKKIQKGSLNFHYRLGKGSYCCIHNRSTIIAFDHNYGSTKENAYQVRTSPCSGENRSQAQISQRSVQEVNNFHGFCSLFQLSLFFSEASEVMVIYLIEYE